MVGLRERKKERTRQALEGAALRLFQRRGFDGTTVEDIAAAVDVSPRTFFRYFESKEEVLFGDWKEQLEGLRVLLADRPADEPLFETVRVLALAKAEATEAQRERYALIRELGATSGGIGEYERKVMWPALEAAVAEAIAERLGVDPAEDPRPTLVAAVGLAVVHSAKARWLQGEPGTRYADEIDAAFAAFGGLAREAFCR